MIDVIRENVRALEETLGDIRAQFGAYRLAERKLLKLLDEEGIDDPGVVVEEILGRSERSMRAMLTEIPDGVYTDAVTADGFAESLTISRPAIEILLNGRVGRKLLRKLPPLAAGRRHLPDRVHHSGQIGGPWPSHPSRLRHERLDQRPFRVRHVACIAEALAPILASSDLSPGHDDPHILCRNNDGFVTY